MDQKFPKNPQENSQEDENPETWKAILTLNDLFKNVFEALKNPNTGFNGEAERIVQELRRQKTGMENFQQVEETEKAKSDIQVCIIHIEECITKLEAHISHETIRAQIQLTRSKLKKDKEQ